jgi:hypothetical protein
MGYMRHPVPFSWAGYGFLFAVVMFLTLWIFEWLPRSYFKAWDSDGSVLFFNDYKINTSSRFLAASMLVILNTVVQQTVGQTLGNYVTNVVADHKCKREDMEGSNFFIHLTIQVYYFYGALSNAIRIFFMFSSFYFVVMQGLATAVVTYFVTERRLHAKLL